MKKLKFHLNSPSHHHLKSNHKKRENYESNLIREKEFRYLHSNGPDAYLPKKVLNFLGSKIRSDLELDIQKKGVGPKGSNFHLYARHERRFKQKLKHLQKLFKQKRHFKKSMMFVAEAKKLILKESSAISKLDILLRHLNRPKPPRKDSEFCLFPNGSQKPKRLRRSLTGLLTRKKHRPKKSIFAPQRPSKPGKKPLKVSSLTQKHNRVVPRYVHTCSHLNNHVDPSYLSHREKSNFFVSKLSTNGSALAARPGPAAYYVGRAPRRRAKRKSKVSGPRTLNLKQTLEHSANFMLPKAQTSKSGLDPFRLSGMATQYDEKLQNTVLRPSKRKRPRKVRARLFEFDPAFARKIECFKSQRRFKRSIGRLKDLCLSAPNFEQKNFGSTKRLSDNSLIGYLFKSADEA